MRTRSKSSGSGGVDGDGEEEEDGMEDGLEGLMRGGNDGGGNKQIRTSRWRVHHEESGGGLDRAYGGEMDRDSDWTRNEGMSSMSLDGHGRVQRRYSGGDEEDDDLGKDNLKWPAGEGWKPL